jgi:hypothetical protein
MGASHAGPHVGQGDRSGHRDRGNLEGPRHAGAATRRVRRARRWSSRTRVGVAASEGQGCREASRARAKPSPPSRAGDGGPLARTAARGGRKQPPSGPPRGQAGPPRGGVGRSCFAFATGCSTCAPRWISSSTQTYTSPRHARLGYLGILPTVSSRAPSIGASCCPTTATKNGLSPAARPWSKITFPWCGIWPRGSLKPPTWRVRSRLGAHRAGRRRRRRDPSGRDPSGREADRHHQERRTDHASALHAPSPFVRLAASKTRRLSRISTEAKSAFFFSVSPD